MNKIINSRVYTHQTKENPPRYARHADCLDAYDRTFYFVLSRDNTNETIEASNIIPIPDEPEYIEQVEWRNVYENGVHELTHKTEQDAKYRIDWADSSQLGKYSHTIKTILKVRVRK